MQQTIQQPPRHSAMTIYPLHQPGEDIFTFFLKEKPASDQHALRPYLEKGYLRITLYYPTKEFLKGYSQSLQVLSSKAALILKQGKEQRIIATAQANGDRVALAATLDLPACDEVWLALQGRPSKLWVHSVLKLRFENDVLFMENNMQLDELFRPSGNDRQNGSAVKITYKYFNVRSGDYLELPARYWIDGNTRAMTRTVAFADEENITSALTALSPMNTTQVPAASMLAASVYNTKLRLNVIDDWVVVTSGNQLVRDLPVIDDATDNFWVNRKNNAQWLALPGFFVVAPALNQPLTNAPFSFVFRNLGPGSDGKPVLEGTVVITVRAQLPDNVRAEANKLNPQRTIKLIEPKVSGFSLVIPYIDKSQKPASFTVAANETSTTGDLTRLVFRLNNQAVRICYSSISADPSQPGYLPLQLLMDVSFSGYTAVKPGKINWGNVVGNRIYGIPVKKSDQPPAAGSDYFNASANLLVRQNGQQISFSDVHDRLTKAVTQPSSITVNAKINSAVSTAVVRPDTHLLKSEPHGKIKPHGPNQIRYRLQTFHRRITLPLSFPCTVFGSFYQEQNAGQFSVVGCRPAYQLGERPQSLYTEITDLRDNAYNVYQSTLSPGQFMVVPKKYIIGRHQPLGNAADYKPCIMLYSSIDVVNNTSTWVLDCTLMPDIDVARRIELEHNLTKYTPWQPSIAYVTELPAKKLEATLSVAGMSGISLSAYPLGKGIRITIETKIDSILILLEMLKQGAIDGSFAFTLDETEIYQVSLAPRLDRISGLWDSGHLEEVQQTQQKMLRNIGGNPLMLTKIRYYLPEGVKDSDLPITPLAPGATIAFPDRPDNMTQWAVYYTEQNPVEITLEEINRYVEDVKCQIIFITVIDFKKATIKDITIEYRLKGNTAPFNVTLDAVNNNSEEVLQMPVTDFMMQRIIEYRIANSTMEDGSLRNGAGNWITHDLSVEGNIINIQSNNI